jgi:hypothetical protein
VNVRAIEPRYGDRCRERRRAGDSEHRHASGVGCRDEACSGVRDHRRAGVRHQGDDVLTRRRDEAGGSLFDVVLGEADEARRTARPDQQRLAGPRVFSGHDRGLPEDALSARREVFQVPDRGGDDVEAGGQRSGH